MGDDKQMKEDLLKIINCYKVSNQLKKLSEEVFELQEAIICEETKNNTQYVRTILDISESTKHIVEEIADVSVMLEQFRIYYGIEKEDIEKIMKKKINRQLNRIEKENKK